MDSERFDQLTRWVIAEGTRRRLVSGIIRGGLASGLAGLGFFTLDDELAVANHCPPGKCSKIKNKKKRRRCRKKCA